MRSAFCLPLAALLVVLAGCDDAIESPESLRGTYTLYGALDPTAAVQAVRVIPVRDTIGLGEDGPLPISVVSVDLASGRETPWRDSLVTFAGGQRGHVYSARTRPAYGSRQRFVVRRDEGGEISALVAVPPRVEPLRRTYPAGGPLRYGFLFPDAPQLNRVSVTYTVTAGGGGLGLEITRIIQGAVGPVEFGWEVVVDIGANSADIARQAVTELRLDAGTPISLNLVTIRGEVASEDWRPPGGVFNPDVLADPEALTNVRGGFGFVGAAYPFEILITPTPCEIRATTFRRTQDACVPEDT